MTTKEFRIDGLYGCTIKFRPNKVEEGLVLTLLMPGIKQAVCETYVKFAGNLITGVESNWSALGTQSDEYTIAFVRNIDLMHKLGNQLVHAAQNGYLDKHIDRIKNGTLW